MVLIIFRAIWDWERLSGCQSHLRLRFLLVLNRLVILNDCSDLVCSACGPWILHMAHAVFSDPSQLLLYSTGTEFRELYMFDKWNVLLLLESLLIVPWPRRLGAISSSLSWTDRFLISASPDYHKLAGFYQHGSILLDSCSLQTCGS